MVNNSAFWQVLRGVPAILLGIILIPLAISTEAEAHHFETTLTVFLLADGIAALGLGLVRQGQLAWRFDLAEGVVSLLMGIVLFVMRNVSEPTMETLLALVLAFHGIFRLWSFSEFESERERHTWRLVFGIAALAIGFLIPFFELSKDMPIHIAVVLYFLVFGGWHVVRALRQRNLPELSRA